MSIGTTDNQSNDANDIIYNEFCKTAVWVTEFDSLFKAIGKYYNVNDSMAAFILMNLELQDKDALRFVRQFNSEIINAYKGRAISADDSTAIAHCVNMLKDTNIAPDESEIMSTFFDFNETGVVALTIAAALLHELQQYLMVITNRWLDSSTKHDSENQNDIKEAVSLLHAYKPNLQSFSAMPSEEEDIGIARLRILADLLKILGVKGFVELVKGDESTVIAINDLLGLTADKRSEKANELVETVKGDFFYLRADIQKVFAGKLVESYAMLTGKASETNIRMIGEAYWNKNIPHNHSEDASMFWRITACIAVAVIVSELKEDIAR